MSSAPAVAARQCMPASLDPFPPQPRTPPPWTPLPLLKPPPLPQPRHHHLPQPRPIPSLQHLAQCHDPRTPYGAVGWTGTPTGA
ncbi:hypothetical protein QJQ45_027572 [Haematococcus lacustris]|nr:hypothetical protein QJQ45_027572 [Haematococcus lacustris]